MKTALQALLFGALAIALHVLAFAGWPREGANSSGAGGEALVSIQASDEQMATLVAQWRAPQTVAQPETLADPAPPRDTAPTATAVDDPPPRPAPMPAQPLLRQPPDAVPAVIDQPMQAPDVADLPMLPQPQVADPAPESALPELTETAQPRRQPAPQPARPQPVAPPEAPQSPPPPPPPEAKPAPAPQPKDPVEPARRTQPAAVATQAQRAAGAGGGTQRGNSGNAETATLSDGQRSSLMASWGGKLRNRIERFKRFPRNARKGGRVVLNVNVARNGSLLGVRVLASSGDAALDQAALDAVRRAGRFAAAPDALPGNSFLFALPISFRR